MNHNNLFHKFIPMPKAMKIPDAKAAVDKEWKKLETIPARKLEKVRSKKEVILEAQRDKKESPLCLIDGHKYQKNAELEPKLQNFKSAKDVSYSVVTLLKMTQAHMLCSLNKARLRHRLLLPRSWM